MHVYVPNWTRTGFPSRLVVDSGGELSHAVARSKAVSWREPPSVAAGSPSTPNSAAASVIAAEPRKARRPKARVPGMTSRSGPVRSHYAVARRGRVPR